ncbi:AsmA family protein [Olivibacter domesticus]|uniref:AsmA-like C-terminal region n=1 Tax=Olivibacter domesticus TaxID=407022 RepID=A0A1H7UEX3_OLID1|nr:AsmA-like C-terminal region-containing protein [Olivibacter domesticus]SEL95346.1 AsmA-like C-terminal region [Olivibacter domesticus]
MSTVFRRVLIVLVIILVLILASIAVVINFVFTPEKITPVALRMINQQLDARVFCDKVELTFFSSFPHFGARLNNGYVLSKNNKDTLAAFNDFRGSVNLTKFLLSKEVDIEKISVLKPRLYVVVDPQGKVNYDILKKETSINEDTLTGNPEIKSIHVKSLLIKDATFHYLDLGTKLDFRIPSLNLKLGFRDDDDNLLLKLYVESKQLAITKGGHGLIKQLHSVLETEMKLDKKKRILNFEDGKLKLNDIDFRLDGQFAELKPQKAVDVVLEATMRVPSLANLWKMLPKRYLKTEDVDVGGKVYLVLSSKGIYGGGKTPISRAQLKIHGGSLRYKRFPGRINQLEADVETLLDFNQSNRSELRINKIILNGTGISVLGSGLVRNLLTKPEIAPHIQAKVDLTKVGNTFPIAEGIQMGGTAALDLNGKITYDANAGFDYRDLLLYGNCKMDNLKVNISKDSLVFHTAHTELNVRRSGMDSLLGHVEVDELTLQYGRKHNLSVKALQTALSRARYGDKQQPLKGEIQLAKLRYQSADSLDATLERATIVAEARPGSKPRSPHFTTHFNAQNFAIHYGKTKLIIDEGSYDFDIKKDEQKRWWPKGSFSFSKLIATIPHLDKPLSVNRSHIAVDGHDIRLNNAFVSFGNFKTKLDGEVKNIFPVDKADTFLYANLNLHARYLDVDEMMKLISTETPKASVIEAMAAPTLAAAPPVKAVEASQNFAIPKNIRFTFNSFVDRLKMGDLVLTGLKGQARIDNGQLNLHDFSLTSGDAYLQTKLRYEPQHDGQARVRYVIDVRNMNMDQAKDFAPGLDTLFPIIQSLEGRADFSIKGSAKLKNDMEIDVGSIKSIAALKASHLTVRNNKAFSELAKTFKFKERDSTFVDSLNVEMLIRDQQLEILPALVEIDRYRLAVGGIQHIDLSYNYHVSVLKSPIPFKTGVDIKGKIPDYNISLAKARYKYYFTDKERLAKKADSTIIKKRNIILKMIDFQ